MTPTRACPYCNFPMGGRDASEKTKDEVIAKCICANDYIKIYACKKCGEERYDYKGKGRPALI